MITEAECDERGLKVMDRLSDALQDRNALRTQLDAANAEIARLRGEVDYLKAAQAAWRTESERGWHKSGTTYSKFTVIP